MKTRSEMRLALKRRRARVLLFGSTIFAVVVLGTGFPVSALLWQRQQLSATAEQVRQLKAQNADLSREEANLSNPSTVAGIARANYGLVRPGQQVYNVLPPSGSSSGSASLSGHFPLDGPLVVPGSAQSQALIGAAPAPSVPSPGSAPGSASSAAGSQRSGPQASRSTGTHPRGFWSRVVATLEFWR